MFELKNHLKVIISNLHMYQIILLPSYHAQLPYIKMHKQIIEMKKNKIQKI